MDAGNGEDLGVALGKWGEKFWKIKSDVDRNVLSVSFRIQELTLRELHDENLTWCRYSVAINLRTP